MVWLGANVDISTERALYMTGGGKRLLAGRDATPHRGIPRRRRDHARTGGGLRMNFLRGKFTAPPANPTAARQIVPAAAPHAMWSCRVARSSGCERLCYFVVA